MAPVTEAQTRPATNPPTIVVMPSPTTSPPQKAPARKELARPTKNPVQYVGTEHLLLGLLSDDTVAAETLHGLGVTKERSEELILKALEELRRRGSDRRRARSPSCVSRPCSPRLL
jgi:ATP-dependent Clp protease ATP-binding subunit ClpA